jgi:hypothetical protein
MTFSHVLAVSTVSLFAVMAPSLDKENTYIDLQPFANQKLKEPLHNTGSAFPNNHLGELAKGKQKLGEVTFDIGESLPQLGSTQITDKPAKIEGIKIERKFANLHILQATSHTAEDDTVIGSYIVHYGDKTTEKIEIVYGKDVRDWWYGEDAKGVTRGKIVWKGDNDDAKRLEKKIRLYMTTWKNPNPDKKVDSIDFVAADGTICAPFCVAMTAEE